MKSQIIFKVLSICVSLMIYSHTGLANLYSVEFSEKDIFSVPISTSTFSRPIEKFDNFWDFCDSSICATHSAGFGTTDVVPNTSYSTSFSSSTPFSATAIGANLSYMPYLDGNVLFFEGGSQNDKFVFNLFSTQDSVSQLQSNEAGGFAVSQSTGTTSRVIETGLGTFYPSGSYDFSVAATFNENEIESGYQAKAKTIIKVNLWSSWFNESGVAEFYTKEVYSNYIDGSGTINVSLPLSFSSYPELDIAYTDTFTYNVNTTSLITLSAISAVPEAKTYLMLLLGLLLIIRYQKQTVEAQ